MVARVTPNSGMSPGCVRHYLERATLVYYSNETRHEIFTLSGRRPEHQIVHLEAACDVSPSMKSRRQRLLRDRRITVIHSGYFEVGLTVR